MKPNKVYSIEVRPNSAVQDDQEKNRGNTFFKKPFTESLKKSRASYDGRLTTSNIVLDKILLENNCSHSRWYLLYAILGPLACFLMDYGAFVLWPMKNAFLHPETWSILYNVQIDKTFDCHQVAKKFFGGLKNGCNSVQNDTHKFSALQTHKCGQATTLKFYIVNTKGRFGQK